eukprot:1151827-Pelagomonas_calceolata.AAC.2
MVGPSARVIRGVKWFWQSGKERQRCNDEPLMGLFGCSLWSNRPSLPIPSLPWPAFFVSLGATVHGGTDLELKTHGT